MIDIYVVYKVVVLCGEREVVEVWESEGGQGG